MIYQCIGVVLLGGVIGGVLGYVGKCRGGACPLTATPISGALLGVLFGGAAALSMGCGREQNSAADDGMRRITSASEYDSLVAASTDQPVLIDFYSPTCGPCARLSPILGKLNAEYGDRVTFAKVDANQAPELVRRHDIEGVPTVIIYHGGEVAHRWSGLRPEQTYRSALEELTSRQQ